MQEIVKVHHPDVDEALLQQALARFYLIREEPAVRKRPSTSELIDWLSALMRAGMTPEQLEGALPFLGVLLKREQDLEAIQNPKPRRRYM